MEKWLKSLSEAEDTEVRFTNFICGEANRCADPADHKFCKNLHQYRMPYNAVVDARNVLMAADLDRLTTFSDILNAVTAATSRSLPWC